MITKEELARRLKNACETVCSAEAELTEIDAKFDDADHGFTMVKICNTIEKAIEESEGTIQEMLDDAAMAVMSLNGGTGRKYRKDVLLRRIRKGCSILPGTGCNRRRKKASGKQSTGYVL